VEEALPLLENIPQIKPKLQTLLDVGLDISSSAVATTLSAAKPSASSWQGAFKAGTGRTIYILDEPTTGLHFADVHKLLDVLQRLVSLGNTVIVIEHNLDSSRARFHHRSGPEAARTRSSRASGTPEEVAACAARIRAGAQAAAEWKWETQRREKAEAATRALPKKRKSRDILRAPSVEPEHD